MRELVIDNFAGGGGASTGIERVTGSVDVAINHDPEAVTMHERNHPRTYHFCENILEVHPRDATRGDPVGMAWFSPDCKHFSKAKGGKPKSKNIRGLAWVVIDWIKETSPRVIFLENVEEFEDWGPLDDAGQPIPDRKGETFKEWVNAIRSYGYQVDWRVLVASEYGAPTIRKRLFLIARRDGRPITWPAPTHGDGLQPVRTAAECIDWSIEVPSIFRRKKPLAQATMARIAKGIQRYVQNDPEPFIVRTGHAWASGKEPGGWRGQTIDNPLATVCATNDKNLVVPFMAKHFGGMVGVRIDTPHPTITAKGYQNQLVEAHLRHGPVGEDVVNAFLIRYNGLNVGQSANAPIGALTGKHRFGLVYVHGEPYSIVDVGMRMLQPRELFRAQGFDDDYVIDPIHNGRRLPKASQVRLVGNSVCPDVAQQLVAANFRPEAPRD